MKKLFFVLSIAFWTSSPYAMEKMELKDLQIHIRERALWMGKDLNDLALAARDGHVDRVIELIDANANVNAQDDCGVTPLMIAVVCGCTQMDISINDQIIERLLDAKADIQLKDKRGKTALRHAVDWMSEPIFRILMRRGLDINMFGEDGNTFLMEEARDGYASRVEFLLKCGANPNIQHQLTKSTALMYAVENEDFPLCALLLRCGACLYLKNKEQKNALMLAAMNAIYGDLAICALFVLHQIELELSMRTFLSCLKFSENPSARALYRFRKDLLAPYLKSFFVQSLLDERDAQNCTAYDAFSLEWLNPYRKKLLALRNPYPQQQLIENAAAESSEDVKKKISKKNKKCSIQ